MRRKLIVASLAIVMLALGVGAAPLRAPADAPTASPAASPTAAQILVPVMPTSTPIPTPTPEPTPRVDFEGHIPCPQGDVCSVYQDGIPSRIDCAPLTICKVTVRGVHLIDGGLIGSATPPPGSGMMAPWSIEPKQLGDDLHLVLSPSSLAIEQSVVIYTQENRAYTLILSPNPAARDTSYLILTPNAHNVVDVPTQNPPTLQYDTTSPSAAIEPQACPARYAIKPYNAPDFWPHAYRLAGEQLSVDFPASTALPVAAVPLHGGENPDMRVLPTVPVEYDVNGAMRTITVLSCYSTVVFYRRDDRGLHAVIFTAVPDTNAP